MNRRQFLGLGAAVGGSFLGDRTIRAARRQLGLWGTPAPPRAAPVVRDPDVAATVASIDGGRVAVRVATAASRDPFRVVVLRRTYPDGSAQQRAASDPLGDGASAGETTIDVEVPFDGAGRGRDSWFYEVYARPGPGGESHAYLCESAPYVRPTADHVHRAPRVTEAKPSVDREAFERRHDGNDYGLTYRWQGLDGETWTVDYRIRRSTHEAAVAADRGYVKTYEESLSSPIAADLLERLDATARPRSGTVAANADGGHPADGALDDDESAGTRHPAGIGVDGTTGHATDADAGTPARAGTDTDADDTDLDDDADGGHDAASEPPTVGLSSLPPGRRFEELVNFVQGVAYAHDARTISAYDYHRTVEETLVAGVGDCKDRTYLLAALLNAGFDCEPALLFQSGHVLLGVRPRDVPDLPYDYDRVAIGTDDWVPIEPSLHVRVGRYPSQPFVAVYGDGEWLYHDTSAMVRGADRVVDTFYDYVV